MPDPTPTTTPTPTATPTPAPKPGGVEGWWKGLGKDQQYALAGSLVGGGTFGALNMLRQGKRNRFKNFLSGVAVGGIGGAAAGYGGSKLLSAKPPKTEEKPGLPKGKVPANVDNGNFVGVGGDKPGQDRTGESVLSTNNLAEGGRQLGRSGLRVGASAGAGAAALPMLAAAKNRAVPSIGRRWNTWGETANLRKATDAQTAVQNALASGKAHTFNSVMKNPLRANQLMMDAALKIDGGRAGAATAELNRRLAAHGGYVNLGGRATDPYLQQLYNESKALTAARSGSYATAAKTHMADEARLRTLVQQYAAKARASAAATPTPLAATRSGFTNKTNILGLGRMRNPILGALMGGGIQTGREINNGPDE